MSEFIHSEKRLAEELGVSRGVVEKLRDDLLKMHKHWRIEHNTVMLTEKGVKTLFKALGVSEKKCAPAVEAVASAGDLEAGRVETGADVFASVVGHSAHSEKNARVVKKFVNTKIMEGEVDGELIRVRVSDSANFRIGMEIPVRPIGGGLWECTRRAPRFPGGRW